METIVCMPYILKFTSLEYLQTVILTFEPSILPVATFRSNELESTPQSKDPFEIYLFENGFQDLDFNMKSWQPSCHNLST